MTSNLTGHITGVGWVTPESMGNRRHQKASPLKDGVPVVERQDVFDAPYKAFGRMDDFTKLGVAAIGYALQDAGIHPPNSRQHIGLIASTTVGCLGTDIRYWESLQKKASSPILFAHTLDSSFLGEAAICFGLTGESFVINEKTDTGLKGLFFALEQLETGPSEAVLCGIVNEVPTNLQLPGIQPFSGALFLVIESCASADLKTSSILKAFSMDHIEPSNGEKITHLTALARHIIQDSRASRIPDNCRGGNIYF